MFGTITERFAELSGNELYFVMARGNKNARDIKITKWFKTNHYYIVPKLSFDSKFSLNPSKILAEFKEAKKLGITPKINIIVPITFLALSKTSNESWLLGALLEQYVALKAQIFSVGIDFIHNSIYQKQLLEKIAKISSFIRHNRINIGTSCSLLKNETLDEKFSALLSANREAINSRKFTFNKRQSSARTCRKFVLKVPFDERINIKKDEFKLVILSTTTISLFL